MKNNVKLIFFMIILSSCASVGDKKLDIVGIEQVSEFSSSINSLLSDKEFLKLEVLKINSNKPSIQRIINEADDLWQKGKLNGANLQLERALRISKSESSVYLRLAHLRREQGFEKEVKAFATKGLQIKNISYWEALLFNIYLKSK